MVSIHTNLSSLIAQGSLTKSTNTLNRAIEQMSTGYKINHASDNAANYSIKTNMDTKIGAYQVAEDNAMMGLDMLQTAESSLNQISDKLSRLRALAVTAQNGPYGDQSLSALNSEAEALTQEINRIFATAKYNGISLFSSTTPSTDSSPDSINSPVTYTNAEIEAMLASGDIVALDDNVTSFTSGQKYLISDETQLVRLATLVNAGKKGRGATFILGSDIDLGAYCDQEIANGNGGWTPIGNSSRKFEGIFDGNGHIIKNLKIDRDEDKQGLFGSAYGDEIKNVGLEGGYVNGAQYVGSLVAYSNSLIENCYSTVTVSGEDNVGGLAGHSLAILNNCYATGDVESLGSAGGLVGSINKKVTNCYATGNIKGADCVGGLVGISAAVTNSYATGSVIGENKVGGLVGEAISNITNSYTTGSVTGISNVGGVIGKLQPGISTNNASVQTDSNAMQMTEEEILAAYSYESMDFTEENGWVVQGGVPKLAWQVASEVNLSGQNYVKLQVGVNSSNSSSVGFDVAFDVSEINSVMTKGLSDASVIGIIDGMLSTLSLKSTEFGTMQNRLMSVLEEINVQYENLVSSRSTIQDADMSEVSATYIQQQILQQASATLMATANQTPAIALQLI